MREEGRPQVGQIADPASDPRWIVTPQGSAADAERANTKLPGPVHVEQGDINSPAQPGVSGTVRAARLQGQSRIDQHFHARRLTDRLPWPFRRGRASPSG